LGKVWKDKICLNTKTIPSMKDLEKFCNIKAPSYTQIKSFLGVFFSNKISKVFLKN
jgi:hypothetical protein